MFLFLFLSSFSLQSVGSSTLALPASLLYIIAALEASVECCVFLRGMHTHQYVHSLVTSQSAALTMFSDITDISGVIQNSDLIKI